MIREFKYIRVRRTYILNEIGSCYSSTHQLPASPFSLPEVVRGVEFFTVSLITTVKMQGSGFRVIQ